MSELTDDEQRLRHASVGVPARIFLVSLSPTPITEIGPSLLLLRSSLLT